MTRDFTRRLSAIAASAALVLSLTSLGQAQAAPQKDTGGLDTSSVIVQLSAPPLATSTAIDRGKSNKINFSGTKTKSVRAQLTAQRNALKSWLRTNAPKAKVTGEYDVALNAVAVRLNGTSIATIQKAPGVTHVGYQNTYVPTMDDPDLALIDGLAGWDAAGKGSPVDADPSTWAGYGIKVGVIDTGIDTTHPCFDDAGFPTDTKQLGNPNFTNNKVIVARVFNNKLNQSGFTAEALQDHGTHVAGTIACNANTAAAVSGADIPYDPSGVAPGALLGSYSVFPGNVESARSEDILNAMQQAVIDGMDVINMSLGGNAHGIQDLNTVAVDNIDRAGVVVAVSAGNEGPGYYTAGSPGSAERALTAGASSVGHFVGAPILTGSTLVTVAAVTDEFPLPATDVTGPLAVLGAPGTLSEACSPLPDGSLTGKIALLSRGTCTFGNKVYNAQMAGAKAVIVVNNRPGDPIAMAGDAAFPTTIGAVMVGLADRDTMMALADEPVTIGADKAYKQTGNDNILMDFSSQGPTDVSNRIKPDVVAPGGNVLSSVPHFACENPEPNGCWAFFSGTSMASPHLAGMAAVVKQAHPTWTAWQIRSAIINTAKVDGVTKTDLSGVETDVLKVGSGLADLDAAVEATLVFSSPSISFGAVPSGSGKAVTKSVTVTNVSDATVSTDVTIAPGAFTTTATMVDLAPGASATIPVSYYIAKGSAPGPVQAHLIVGTEHVALFALAK